MRRKIETLIEKTKASQKTKKYLYIFLCIFYFGYLFSVMSFSGRAPYNYIAYFLMIVLSILVFLYSFLFTKIRFDFRIFLYPAFVAFAIIGTILYSHAFRNYLTLVLLALSYIVFYYSFLCINNRKLTILLSYMAFCLFAIYYIVIYFDQLIAFSSLDNARLGSYFDNVNAVGSLFTIACFLSLFFIFFKKKNLELLHIIPLVIFFYLGNTTGSRTFLVAFIIGLIAIVFFKFRKQRILLALILIGFIGLLSILINMPFMETLKERVDKGIMVLLNETAQYIEMSTVTRALWMKYGFYLGTKNLIFGLGSEGFRLFSGVGTYTHSDISEIFCNFGIIGFVLYYLIYIVTFFDSSKARHDYKYLALSVLVVFLFRGFLGVNYNNKMMVFLFALSSFLCLPTKINGGIKTADEFEHIINLNIKI